MKMQEAMELGAACGLDTVEDALRNVYINAVSLFMYSELAAQLEELERESNDADLDQTLEAWFSDRNLSPCLVCGRGLTITIPRRHTCEECSEAF